MALWNVQHKIKYPKCQKKNLLKKFKYNIFRSLFIYIATKCICTFIHIFKLWIHVYCKSKHRSQQSFHRSFDHSRGFKWGSYSLFCSLSISSIEYVFDSWFFFLFFSFIFITIQNEMDFEWMDSSARTFEWTAKRLRKKHWKSLIIAFYFLNNICYAQTVIICWFSTPTLFFSWDPELMQL